GRPQGLSWLAAQLVIILCDGRQADDEPLFTVARGDPAALPVPVLWKDAAHRIVFVPARVHEHDPAVFAQARAQRSLVPVPDVVPDQLAVGLFAVLDQVVEQGAVRAPASDATAYADGVILAALV